MCVCQETREWPQATRARKPHTQKAYYRAVDGDSARVGDVGAVLAPHCAPAASERVSALGGKTGEEAASNTKSIAIDGFVSSYPVPDDMKNEFTKELKEILGAEDVNLDDLKGVNYSVGAFVNLSF